MVRGTRIHETFETFYENVDETPGVAALPDDRSLWADFIDPYVSNFIQWEKECYTHVEMDIEKYAPVSVEEEHWRDPILGLDGEPEWMGLADVILPAARLPSIESDDGVVVVDFKTGSVPDREYRNPGIYTELEYYSILFEEKYDVVGAGAYYPRESEFLVKPDDDSLRDAVREAAGNMVRAVRDYDGSQKFEAKEGPLCKWGTADNEESSFYGVCSQCTWGAPAKNEETFRTLVDEGYGDRATAEYLGCSPDAVRYWKYKFDLL